MKLFCYLHFFPPVHNAGSETTVHAAMRAMIARGHEVTVLADQTPDDYMVDGIQVLSPPKRPYTHDWTIEQTKGFDVILTHLDCSGRAMNLSIDTGLPLVHFIHNSMQMEFHSITPNKAQLVIFNSQWIADKQRYKDEPWPGESIVMHPIVEPERYQCERGTKIVFCNPTDGKGVATVHKLAEALPQYEFLIVEGHYGEQVSPPNLGDEWVAAHPNVTHMKNDPDFRNVLRQAYVVLMPSNYESYGRCAVEAACAGIPSIVHPTEGLLEALGGAGIYCDRDDVPAWKAEIDKLFSNEIYYKKRSDLALKLADSLDPESEFDRLEVALIKVVADWKKAQEVNVVMMWTSDKRIWEMTDGTWVAEQGGRIPQGALRMAAGIGTEVPEEIARAHGFLPPLVNHAVSPPEPTEESTLLSSKSLQPNEDKAQHAPEENKSRKKKVA